MKTMYRTKGFFTGSGDPVEAVEVLRDSEKCVWVKSALGRERRCLKITDYECWFDTYDEAASHLRAKFQAKLDAAKRSHEIAEKLLAALEEKL